MSGFFLVRRDAIDLDALRPRGFKILLESVDPHAWAPVRRGVVRVRRATRRPQQGDDPRGDALPVAARAPAVRPLRDRRRSQVSSSTPSLLAVLTDVVGPVLRRVGGDRDAGRRRCGTSASPSSGCSPIASTSAGRGHRMALFFLMNNVALALRGPAARAAHLRARDPLRGLERALAGGPHARALRARRHLDLGEGARRARRAPRPFSYDIHGIVTVKSDVRLPELERFRVGELIGEPDIRVRLGRVAANGTAGPPSTTARARAASGSAS